MNIFTVGDRVKILAETFKGQWGRVERADRHGASVAVNGEVYMYLPHEVELEWKQIQHEPFQDPLVEGFTDLAGNLLFCDAKVADEVRQRLNRF